MSHKHKPQKIVIPTQEEIAEVMGDAAAQAASTVDGQTPAGDPAQSQPADASANQPSAGQAAPADEFKDKFLRAKAELLNYQRRAEKSHEEALRYAPASLARSFLPVIDNLQRVVDAGGAAPEAQPILDGVRLTLEQALKALAEHGIAPIEGTGQPFDPAVHEAMMQQPSTEHPPGTVLQVLTRGYRMQDRVLRPAKVIVAKE